jgi:hypothetical protein
MTVSNDMLLELLCWLVGLLGGGLIGVLIWLGNKFIDKVASMDGKIDIIHDAMLACDGCREALGKTETRRRSTDLLLP